MRAVILVSHGSRSTKTKNEIIGMVNRLKAQLDAGIVTYAFLEIEQPTILEAMADCVAQGALEICILLNFLNSGRHVDVDIPHLVHIAREQYPHVIIKLTKPIGQHPKMIDLLKDLLSS